MNTLMNTFRLAIHSTGRPLVLSSIAHKPFFFLPFFLALFISACGGGGGGGTNPPPNTNPSGLSSTTSVNATAGDGQVTVGWSSVVGATSYNIYINTGSNVSTSSYSKKSSGTASPVIVSGLQNGIQHSVMVTATDSSSESSASQIVQFTPLIVPLAAVSDFAAVPGNNSVTVNWTAVANATDYLIQHGTDANFISGVGNLYTSSTSYTFNNLVNGTTYYYRILARSNSSQSSYSAVVSAIPNYATGWNNMVEVARLGHDIYSDLYSRNDDLNSSRDALCTWTHGETVYASTYTKTTDWATSVIISPSGVASSSSLSENGDGVVAWAERTYTDPPTNNSWHDDIVVKHYQAGIWGSVIPLSGAESGAYAKTPKIKLDKDGNGVVVWHGDDGNFYVKTYDKATTTWSAATKINTVVNIYYDRYRIDVGGNGVFVLVWDELTATSQNINRVFLRKYSKAGGWGATETVNLDNPALDAQNSLQSVSVNANGDIFVLWKHSTSITDYQLMFRRYASATASWSTPVSVNASNFSLDWGKVKSNSSSNAIIYWKKRDNNAGTIVESNNFAVYNGSTGTIGPTEEMLKTAYDIYTVDIVTDAANSFRMFYGVSGPTHAYERDYNFTTQTWGAPVIINQYFGNTDYIATSNTAGEMMLTTNTTAFDSLTFQSWELIRAKFYLP
jgi:hypothetical protein